jgi:hypothetical protein
LVIAGRTASDVPARGADSLDEFHTNAFGYGAGVFANEQGADSAVPASYDSLLVGLDGFAPS